LRGEPDIGTIGAAPAFAVGLIGYLVVALPRRLAALLIALIATVSMAGTAFGSPKDVINDFSDNGVVDACHSSEDYGAARREGVVSAYGDIGEAIDIALDDPALVGTAAKPCPVAAAADGGSGIAGALLVGIPVGLCAIALAMLYRARRRRVAVEADEPDEPAA
jgi:hypothetical protein